MVHNVKGHCVVDAVLFFGWSPCLYGICTQVHRMGDMHPITPHHIPLTIHARCIQITPKRDMYQPFGKFDRISDRFVSAVGMNATGLYERVV